jgi:hypothetical protein
LDFLQKNQPPPDRRGRRPGARRALRVQ